MLHRRQSSRQVRRSIVFWIFIVISLPIMVLVVGYASGYRFDNLTRSLKQQSALAIETTPKNASVVLNGIMQDDKTPFIVTLTPGEYTVEIQKEGFYTWKKKLNLTEGKSEIFPDVLLFQNTVPLQRNTPPKEVQEQKLQPLDTSFYGYYSSLGWPDPSRLQMLDYEQPLLIDALQSVAYIIPALNEFSDEKRINGTLIDAEWSPDAVLLYVTEFELWIYDKTNQEHVLLTRRSSKILDATWHPDGGNILFSDEAGLYSIELDSRDNRQVTHINQIPSPTQLKVNSQGDILTFRSGNVWYDQSLY